MFLRLVQIIDLSIKAANVVIAALKYRNDKKDKSEKNKKK